MKKIYLVFIINLLLLDIVFLGDFFYSHFVLQGKMIYLKKKGENMNHNKKRLCIISLLLMGLFFCCSMEQVNAKNKVVTPKIIKKIYQRV